MQHLTDTHCHLNLDSFKTDLTEVVDRAMDAGITRILVPGIDVETSQTAIDLSETYSLIYASVGIHPNSAKIWDANTLKTIRELSQHPKVVAIGEIGLDYYRDRTPHELQMRALQEQLQLAAEIEKPVILHSRQASHKLLPEVFHWQNQLIETNSSLAMRPGVLHSFEGNLEEAALSIDHNFFLSISGPVTYKNATTKQKIVSQIPLSAILIETDAPFLTPHPFRGKRNEPAYVTNIAQKIADLHNRPLSDITVVSSKNANQLFLWSNSS